jgi:hypothetical protein
MDIPHRERMIFLAEQIEDGLAGTGQFARSAPEAAGQLGEREVFAALGGVPMGMGVGVLSHGRECFWRWAGGQIQDEQRFAGSNCKWFAVREIQKPATPVAG